MHHRGFTLIQLSILLTVASLVLIAVLPASQSKLVNDKATASKLNTVLSSIRQYQSNYGYLPCPADASQRISSTTYGVAAANGGTSGECTGGTPAANYTDGTNNIAVGMVPVRALGLSNDYALDAYGRDITYAVDNNATSCWAGTTLPGQIIVTDNGAVNNTVAALISHGQDGHGAWMPLSATSGSAVRLNAGSTDTGQLTNAHVNSSFTPVTPLTNFVRQEPTATFDDIVTYKSSQWTLNSMPVAFQNANPPIITSPANGIYYSGQTFSFILTFSSAVTVTGTPRLSLYALTGGSIGTGNVAYATYASGSGTTSLTFTYTVLSTDTAPNGIGVASPVQMNGGRLSPCYVFFTSYTLPGVIIPLPCSAYAYNRAITINSSQVPNTNQTNFPILVSGTYAYLGQGNGNGTTASVQNSSGDDIIFAASQTAQPLSFEQETYNSSNGQINYWVRIPTLSHTTNTTIYVCYGNSNVANYQSSASATWDSFYKGVWHLENGTVLNTNDSTTNANNGVLGNGGPAAYWGGEIGAGAYFNNTNENVDFGHASSITFNGPITIETWVYPLISNAYQVLMSQNDASTTNRNYAFFLSQNGTSTIYVAMGGNEIGNLTVSPGWAINTFNHIVLTADGTNLKVYINGALANTTASTSVATNTAGRDTRIGAEGTNYPLDGTLDEPRISNTARSADWISTEYNNISSPSTFYSIGAAVAR